MSKRTHAFGGVLFGALIAVLGTVSILAYTIFGGMWSVAVTDFVQMIVLVAGLAIIAVFAADQAGGADKVIALASSRELFRFLPEPEFKDILFFIGAAMGGSMFLQQYMTPAVGDPAQRKMMLVMMPAMMTFMFAQSPAGLTIYYFVFNLIGIVQTWWVMRSYKPQPIVL